MMDRAIVESRRHRGLLIVGLLALSGASLAGVCAWAYADALFSPGELTLALQAFARRDFERAAQILEPFVAKHPNRVEARRLLGEAYLRLNRPQAAATQFMAATKLSPKDASLWKEFGEAARLAGWRERALAAYARATDLAPKDAKAWRERGLLELEAGDQAMALLSLSRSYELDDTQRDLPELIARAARGPERDLHEMETRGGLGLAAAKRTTSGVVLPTPPDPLAEINRSRREVKR